MTQQISVCTDIWISGPHGFIRTTFLLNPDYFKEHKMRTLKLEGFYFLLETHLAEEELVLNTEDTERASVSTIDSLLNMQAEH